MSSPWPLHDLRVRTPRLRLQVPAAAEIAALCDHTRAGLFGPGDDNVFAWHGDDPDARALATVQWQARCIADWKPDDWRLSLAVIRAGDGTVLGCQDISARQFATRREVVSGSWLAREHRGQGYGVEMRTAVLVLARTLGARWACSEALLTNAASLGVSYRCGYADDGVTVGGDGRLLRRLRVDLDTWDTTTPVTVEGLDGCRSLFGT